MLLMGMIRQNLATIGPVLSEVICLIKIRKRQTDGQTNGQTEMGDLSFRTLGVIKDRKNVKVESRPRDSITILPLRSGSKSCDVAPTPYLHHICSVLNEASAFKLKTIVFTQAIFS